MKRFRKVYLEISNLCNLHCSFCPGTHRRPKVMDAEEMGILLPKLQPWTAYLYFHLMGGPLLHPQLETFLSMAGDAGFKVILTTNGTLLPQQQEMLLSSPALHKVNISLHAFEANDLAVPFCAYLAGCLQFGQQFPVIINFSIVNNGTGFPVESTCHRLDTAFKIADGKACM